MKEYYFTFRSLTLAQRALAFVLQRGERAKLIRAPKLISSYGCSYAVLLTTVSAGMTAAAMQISGFGPDRIFRISAAGHAEEIRI